jgi:hypothetical protein
MPRCRKILANGERCKAHAMAGSKFCLFHTPGQRMKRGRKSSMKKTEGRSQKSALQVSAENQFAMRGTRLIGAAIAGSAIRYMNASDYTIVRTKEPARINRQGTVYVSAHERRVIEPTRSDWGRNFKQTDKPASKRKQATTRFKVGRTIPYLGIGYMVYNLGTNRSSSKDRDKMEGFWLYDLATAGEYVVRQTVKAGIISTLTGGVFDAADAAAAGAGLID